MLNYQDLIEQGKQAGFTHVAPLKVSTIQLMSEVRDMCATNSCGAYGKNGAVLPAAVTWIRAVKGSSSTPLGSSSRPWEIWKMKWIMRAWLKRMRSTRKTTCAFMSSSASSSPTCLHLVQADVPNAKPVPFQTPPAASQTK